MKTGEVLTLARERLNKGWTQGRYFDHDGSLCMVGALMNAVAGVFSDRHILSTRHLNIIRGHSDLLERVIREQYPELPLVALPDFNDTPGRTKEEVLNIFDKAILSLQEVGN